ncbi:MAG: aminoglycoside phosphotransferase family protein [Chloroflexota bacterium]|nr:aminoglycoside phosphotransferase family protein [Chloroflexota bacterium]
MSSLYPDLGTLLDAHGLTGRAEEPLIHSGYSGAALTKIVRGDGDRFVLKRMSIARDWIMRATDDSACREAGFALSGVALGERIRTPTVGAARDNGGYALLMRDISDHLLPQNAITAAELDAIIEKMAELHSVPLPEARVVPWCGRRQRLLLLTPAGARVAATYDAGVAPHLARGWALFDELAPRPIVELIRALSEDPTPLIDLLASLPRSLLHGDLKFDNIGLDDAGRMWLIDWAMPMLAPPAVELGWFLAINSRRLPATLDETTQRYTEAARIAPKLRARHDAATVLCGLLLRGWRKALDADDGEPGELQWWCERAADARRFLR